MAPKMEISRRFKNVEHTKNYVNPESEESVFIASLGVALEAEFQRKSLEFIVRSILVRNTLSLALWKGAIVDHHRSIVQEDVIKECGVF